MFARTNFAVARAAAEALRPPLDPALVARAAADVRVPGRFERVGDAPRTIADGAHNPSGMAALAAALDDAVPERPLVAVLSVLDDKDAAGMLRELLPRCDAAVLCAAPTPRALPPATLASLAAQLPARPPRSSPSRARPSPAPARSPGRAAP